MSDNAPMGKDELRQILARNLRQAMANDSTIGTQEKLAARSGLSQSHVSRLLLCEAAATTDALVILAKAAKCQPWELLTDTESTRRAAIEKMLGAQGIPDAEVEKHMPRAPKTIAARRRKKAD